MARRHHDEQYEQVSGIFNNRRDLEELVSNLETRGVADEDISILMSENTRDQFFASKESSKAPEGATIGGISGGLLGAIAGGLTIVGSVLIPGVGLLAAGPLVGAIVGGAAGVATGGLIGGLVGAGIPEHEAKFYENALKEEGNTLVVAHVLRDHAKEIRALFERLGAKQIKVHH